MGQLLPRHIWTFLFFMGICSFSLSAQSYTMNGNPITDCEGFFQDSGGGSANYGLNENFTTVICSDGTEGTHIQLIFSSIDIGPGESITFYDADNPDPAFAVDGAFLLDPTNPFIIQATAANLSGCITVVFTSDGTDEGNTGWSADINCIAACQIILADLVNTTPAMMPVDTGWIDICPGDRVSFNGSGIYPQDGLVYNHSDQTSTFEWDFGNGNTAIGPNVTNVFDEPGGYIVQLEIRDQFGCENTNFISQRIRVSPYPSYQFGGSLDPTICSGDSIMVTSSIDPMSSSNVTVFPNTGTFAQAGVRSDTLLLPDGSGGQYQESISFTQFRPGATLTNPSDICSVTLDLEHSYSGDLDIELICPDGTSIYILDYPSGLGSTNFGEPFASNPVDGQSSDVTPGIPYTYTFTETAPNGTLPDFDGMAPTYTYTTVPSDNNGNTFTYTDSYFPEGEYQPEESFANFLGCPLNGDWTIRVTDNLGLDNGWLFEWSITFKDYLFPDVETFTPTFVDYGWETNPTVISATQDSILASPVNAGFAAYTFFVLDDFGCLNDTTLNFEVLPPTHPDCYNCAIEFEEQEDVVLCEGETANLDLSQIPPIAQPITFERFPQYPVGNANHPPGNAYRSPLNVNSINPIIITNPLSDIESVCFSLTTDFAADVNVSLEAPDGSIVPLSTANGGGSNQGFINTCFSPSALMSINAGTPPYTGEFQPEGNWNSLIGSPINGEWELLITDAFGPLQFGELLEWSITFNNENEYTYTWTPSGGLNCTDCPTPVANPPSSTLYEILIEDEYGCSVIDSVLVAVIEDVPAPVVSCDEQGGDLLFSWLPIPGVTEYEYNLILPSGPQGWMGPITDLELLVQGLNNGDMVTIEVRAFFNGTNNNCIVPLGSSTCTSSFCDLEISLPVLTDVSCFGFSDGEAVINIDAGEAPFSILIDGVTYADPTIGNLIAGDYDYTVMDALGCEIMSSFTINTPDSLFADAAQTLQSCAGLNESETMVVAGGGGGSYTYAWSNGQSDATATDLAVGAYDVTVTDNLGCQVIAATTVAELAPITFNFIAEPPTCNGYSDGGVGINQIMGGLGMSETDYSYEWEDGTNSLVRTDVPGGILYSVTVTDAQGCSASQDRFLMDPEAVDFGFMVAEPSCNGYDDGAIEVINPSGPNGGDFTFQWGPAAGNQTTAQVDDIPAGTYTVTVRDEEGCETTLSEIVDEPTGLSVDFSIKDNECFGYNDGSIGISVTGGIPGYNYSWPSGSTASSLDNLIAGNYEITITDANGCEDIRTATVNQPVALIATIDSQDVSCYGERDGMLTINTEGGTPPFRFSLDNQNYIGSNVLIGLFGGDYNIFIEDANGCQFLTNATVVEPGEFIVDAGPDLEIVYGDSIELAGTTTNAQGDVEYVWYAPYEGTLSCKECQYPFASPESTIDYELYAIDENGCEDTDLLRVFVDKPKLAVVPTGFTPNGDGINDLLLVHGRPGTQVILFQIFDRWGEMLYAEEDFPVNTANRGWDGSYRGEPLNGGVFVWSLTVLHEDGTEEILKGQTTLIR